MNPRIPSTLNPGDLIYTGTPGNTRAMQPGDVVEVEIEGIGRLRNTVLRPLRERICPLQRKIIESR